MFLFKWAVEKRPVISIQVSDLYSDDYFESHVFGNTHESSAMSPKRWRSKQRFLRKSGEIEKCLQGERWGCRCRARCRTFPSLIQWHRSKTSWSIAHIALSLVSLGAQLSQTPDHSLIYINRDFRYPHELEEHWIRKLIDAFSSHPHYGCHSDAWSRYKYK